MSPHRGVQGEGIGGSIWLGGLAGPHLHPPPNSNDRQPFERATAARRLISNFPKYFRSTLTVEVAPSARAGSAWNLDGILPTAVGSLGYAALTFCTPICHPDNLGRFASFCLSWFPTCQDETVPVASKI